MIEGRCLCGAVRIAAEPTDERLWACHCGLCVGWTGATQFGFDVAPERVTVEGEVAEYRSTPFSTRAWCPACGTALWLRDDGKEYELSAGLFPATREWPLRAETYVDRAWAAMRLSGDHRRVRRAEYEAERPHVSGEAR